MPYPFRLILHWKRPRVAARPTFHVCFNIDFQCADQLRKLHSKRPVEKDPLAYYDGCLVSADGSFALTMIPKP
jgi:hypothetical protein